MRRISVLALIVGATLLFGCKDSLESQHERIEKFVKTNRIGSGSDAWLIKHNTFGDFERVALVFGFINDSEFCQDIAELYMKKYPADRYICMLAN